MPRERPTEGSWAAAILLLPEKGTVGGATRAQSPGRGVSVVQSASPPTAQAVRRWPQGTLGYNACSLHPPASALTPEKSEPQSEWGEEREVEGERRVGSSLLAFTSYSADLGWGGAGCGRGHERIWEKLWMSAGSFDRGLDRTADYLKIRSF